MKCEGEFNIYFRYWYYSNVSMHLENFWQKAHRAMHSVKADGAYILINYILITYNLYKYTNKQ